MLKSVRQQRSKKARQPRAVHAEIKHCGDLIVHAWLAAYLILFFRKPVDRYNLNRLTFNPHVSPRVQTTTFDTWTERIAGGYSWISCIDDRKRESRNDKGIDNPSKKSPRSLVAEAMWKITYVIVTLLAIIHSNSNLIGVSSNARRNDHTWRYRWQTG